jgi:transposase
MRRILDAILYLLHGGRPWRMLPPCLRRSRRCRIGSTCDVTMGYGEGSTTNLLVASRKAQGREASPSAGAIDSQSAKTTESGRRAGDDEGKKIKDRKRHILTDAEGNLSLA